METTYQDFIKSYLQNKKDDDLVIQSFKKHIDRSPELWMEAELAIGKYTDEFDSGNDGLNAYLRCHEDLCEKLADYLHEKEDIFSYCIRRIYFTNN